MLPNGRPREWLPLRRVILYHIRARLSTPFLIFFGFFLKKKIPGVNSAVQIGTVFAPGACGVIKSGTGDPESEQKREGKQAPCPDAPCDRDIHSVCLVLTSPPDRSSVRPSGYSTSSRKSRSSPTAFAVSVPEGFMTFIFFPIRTRRDRYGE